MCHHTPGDCRLENKFEGAQCGTWTDLIATNVPLQRYCIHAHLPVQVITYVGLQPSCSKTTITRCLGPDELDPPDAVAVEPARAAMCSLIPM